MYKVFPATLNSEGQKVPLIRGWAENASNDPAQLQAWQNQFGSLLHFWGLPMGPTNGLIALDVDVKEANGFETYRRW